MSIIVYTKTGCAWSTRVMDYLKARNIPFEERNITMDLEYKKEIEEKSGRSKTPTVDIDGAIIPDAGVEDVAMVLAKTHLI